MPLFNLKKRGLGVNVEIFFHLRRAWFCNDQSTQVTSLLCTNRKWTLCFGMKVLRRMYIVDAVVLTYYTVCLVRALSKVYSFNWPERNQWQAADASGDYLSINHFLVSISYIFVLMLFMWVITLSPCLNGVVYQR